MKTKRPLALKKGDAVGIMAPSSRVDRKTVEKAAALIEARGFTVEIHPQTWRTQKQSAGTPQEKAAALHDLFADKSIRAIFCARGGNRAGYMLEHLDYDLIAKNPKIVMGYSDVTALLNAIQAETGLVTFHGPMAGSLCGHLPRVQIDQCFNLLAGKGRKIEMNAARAIRPGKTSGKLVGGNLSLVCALMGTPWEPDFNGAILFLEDCGDEVSRIDRMFLHLRNAGVFDRVAGVVLGGFTDLGDNKKNPFGFSLKQIVAQALEGYDIPVLMGAPFGHGRDLVTLPVGLGAALTVRKGGSSLKLDGPAVRL